MPSSPWPMAARATSLKPTSPQPKPPLTGATLKLRYSLLRAPRPACPSVRLPGCKPTISSTSKRLLNTNDHHKDKTDDIETAPLRSRLRRVVGHSRAASRAGAGFQSRSARLDRNHRARISGLAPGGDPGGDGRTGKTPDRRGGREASGRGQGIFAEAVLVAKSGHAWQSRTATSPSSNSSITIAATASAP